MIGEKVGFGKLLELMPSKVKQEAQATFKLHGMLIGRVASEIGVANTCKIHNVVRYLNFF